MFGDYVFEKSSAPYTTKILLIDDEGLNEKTDYLSAFSAHGFSIINYQDDLTFRIQDEHRLKDTYTKLVIIARSDQYVPYDIIHKVTVFKVTTEELFPKLNQDLLNTLDKAGLELLSAVYPSNFDDLRRKEDTERYLRHHVYSGENVKAYLQKTADSLIEKARKATNYKEWFTIAEEKAQLDVMSVQYESDIVTREINTLFQRYVLVQFGKLSQNIDKASPVVVSKAMDYMHDHSEKFIVIIMDGMSEFDWNIISASFSGLPYEKSSMFAMIPSTTSISRQCLLSNKYPSQLQEPWKQSKEKAEFEHCAKELGFTNNQIGYGRGYDAQFDSFVQCGAVIINDIDNIVHAQTQGMLGMFNDISVLANQKKLLTMTQRFLTEGYDVYITADHGNTACIGKGKLMGTGVEVETKSHRMLALNEFANKEELIEQHHLIEYPKYYLPKEYHYLICDGMDTFDAKGEHVMTHGGISLDEVIVPFIKIKATQKNG